MQPLWTETVCRSLERGAFDARGGGGPIEGRSVGGRGGGNGGCALRKGTIRKSAKAAQAKKKHPRSWQRGGRVGITKCILSQRGWGKSGTSDVR